MTINAFQRARRPNARGPVPRQSGTPVWTQIAETLAREIRDRAFCETGCLPAEHALATRFKVKRHTLRKALAHLRQAGLIRVEQGRGSFIQSGLVDAQAVFDPGQRDG
jgi:GntR family phosphonate transport system transcriptional regulator